MAITASKTKNLYCSAYSSSLPYVISVSFTESSTSTSNNTSTLSLSGSIKSTGVAWDSNYDCYLKLYWYDNNTSKRTLVKTSTAFQDLGKNASKSVSGTITATHKSDGSLSGYAILEYVAGSTSGGYAPASNEVQTGNTDLTTIPRASSFTLSGSALGSAVNVAITRASTSFTHKVEYKIGNSAYTTVSSNAGTSASFTPATATYASQNTTGTNVACTVVVTTYNGTTQIGSSSTKSITLSIPTSVIPTCSDISFTRIDNSVPSSWGVYVKGYSQVKATISGTGVYGSTIKSYSLNGAGKTVNSTTLTSDKLSSATTYTFEATVTDSRNRTSAKKTNSITVYDYWKPSVELTAYRCDSNGNASNTGTYLRVKATYSYASVNGKNSVSGKITCNGVTLSSFASGAAYTMNTNMSTTSAYIATCTITDGLGNSASFNVSIPTSSIPFMLRDDETGACFGGYSTKTNTLESFWPLYVHGNISSNGKAVSLDGHTHDYSPSNHTHSDYSPTTHTHDNYLSKSGGTASWLTVSGALQPSGGQYVHYANAGGGTDGYFKIATIVVQTQYMNAPFRLTLTQRSGTQLCEVCICFANADNTDPNVEVFKVDHDYKLYLHKSATSTWDLYIKKSQTWDNVGVLNYEKNHNFTNVAIDWKNELVTSLPSGYIQATLDNSTYSLNGAKEGEALDVLWTGSSKTPSFSISDISNYKYFLIQVGDESSAFATWIFCPYAKETNASTIRGIGGWETKTTNGGEIYFVRGTYTSGTFAIEYACYRRTTTMTTNSSTVQLYVKKIVGVK